MGVKSFLKSRTVWGVVVAALGVAFGWSEATQSLIAGNVVDIIDKSLTVAGLVLAVYGRVKAETALKWALVLCVAGSLQACGATYRVTRTMPSGGTLEAFASTWEKSDAIVFTFEGDLDRGTVTKLTFRKQGAVPALDGATVQALAGLLGSAAKP